MLVFVRRFTIPPELTHYKGNTLLLIGITADELGFAEGRNLQRSHDHVDIVAVHPKAFKSKQFILSRRVIDPHSLIVGAVDLQMVEVEQGDQIVEPIVNRSYRRLLDKVLLHLTVADEHVHLITRPCMLGRHRHASRGGNTLARRSRAAVNTHDLSRIEMSLQMRSVLAKRPKILVREKTPIRQNGMQSGTRVAPA